MPGWYSTSPRIPISSNSCSYAFSIVWIGLALISCMRTKASAAPTSSQVQPVPRPVSDPLSLPFSSHLPIVHLSWLSCRKTPRCGVDVIHSRAYVARARQVPGPPISQSWCALVLSELIPQCDKWIIDDEDNSLQLSFLNHAVNISQWC